MWVFRPRALPKEVKSMLVISHDNAVITCLVLKNIQRTNPDLKITIITNRKPIFAHLMPNVMIYDEPVGNPISIYFSETMRKLRKETFDIAIFFEIGLPFKLSIYEIYHLLWSFYQI